MLFSYRTFEISVVDVAVARYTSRISVRYRRGKEVSFNAANLAMRIDRADGTTIVKGVKQYGFTVRWNRFTDDGGVEPWP